MKILFVHEVSWRKKVVYEIHDFPELLSLHGHDVSFLEYDEEEGNFSSSPVQLTRGRFSSTYQMARGHVNSAVRIITPSRFLPGISGRLLAVFLHPFIIWNELRNNRPDVVVLYGIPTNGWQTVMISRHLKVPIMLRAIDVSHQLRPTSFSFLIRKAETFVYRNTGLISANNAALVDYISKISQTTSPIDVLVPGVDLVKFVPGPKPVELSAKYKIQDDDKVILFMGTLFRFSGLYELIGSAAEVLLADPKLKILIIGDGEDQYRINKVISELNLIGKVICVGRIEYEVLHTHLLLGDVAILPFLQTDVTECAFPGKVLQYLSAGIPTISMRLRGLESTFPDNSGFIFVSNTDEMIMQCLKVLNDDDYRSSLSLAGRRTMEEMCNWVSQVKEFEKLLLQTIGTTE